MFQGCRALTDDVQARLALNFANCFLIKTGMKSYNCPKELQVSDCLKDIDNNAFTAYSNFFTVSDKLRRLGIRNWIVNDSKLDSDEIQRRLYTIQNSTSHEILSNCMVLIPFQSNLIYFWLNWTNFCLNSTSYRFKCWLKHLKYIVEFYQKWSNLIEKIDIYHIF